MENISDTVGTIRHQDFTVGLKEFSVGFKEKTPKPTVFSLWRVVTMMWETVQMKQGTETIGLWDSI